MDVLPHAQPFTGCRTGDVASQALLTSIDEVYEAAKELLSSSREIVGRAGFRTVTGSFRGVEISVVLTPPGASPTAIAVEELTRIGVRTFVGIWGGIALTTSLNVGDVVLASSAIKGDGVSKFYAPPEVPASADFGLLQRLAQLFDVKAFKFVVSPVWSNDIYYLNGSERESLIRAYSRLAVAADMSTAALYTMALVKKLSAAAVIVVEANPIRGVEIGELLVNDGEKKELREKLLESLAQVTKAVLEAMTLHYEHVRMERRSEQRARV